MSMVEKYIARIITRKARKMSTKFGKDLYFIGCVFYFLLSARSSQKPLPGYRNGILVFKTQMCPKNESQWRASSYRLNCLIDNYPPVDQYYCLPTAKRDMVVEFCYDKSSKLTDPGNCLELGGKGYLNYVNCTGFIAGCPDHYYYSEEIYKHQACLQIDVNRRCFLAEEGCKLTSSSTTESTPRSSDSPAYALFFIVIIIAVVIAVLVAVFWFLRERGNENLPALEISSSGQTHTSDSLDPSQSDPFPSTNTDTESSGCRNKVPEYRVPLLGNDNMENGIPFIKINDDVSISEATFGGTICILGNAKKGLQFFESLKLEWQKSISKGSKEFETFSIDNSKYMGSSVDPSQPLLIINSANNNDAIRYRIMCQYGDGHITSNEVEVLVHGDKPNPKLKEEYSAHAGTALSMYGDLNCIPSPSEIKWQYCKERFGEFTEIKATEKRYQVFKDDKHAELVINPAKLTDSGYYRLVVCNILGESISNTAFLKIVKDSKLTSKSLSLSPFSTKQRQHADVQGNTKRDQNALPNALKITTLDVPNIGLISHISNTVNDTMWISDDKGNLLHINMQGTILYQLSEKSLEAMISHTITKTNDLLYTKEDKRKVLKLANTCTDIPVEIISTGDWIPTCIYSSHIDESILVGQTKGNKAKVVRYNKTGILENEIQENLGKALFQHPYKITENQECYMYVVDKKAKALLGLNREGDLKFTYSSEDTNCFYPSGVCIDRYDHILVSNYRSDNIHILDKNGQFLEYLSFTLNKSPLNCPRALCSDGKGRLFVGQSGQKTSAQVKVYKYGQIDTSN